MSDDTAHLRRAVELACDNVRNGGHPFGAVIVREGEVLCEAVNTVAATSDPTAHAELVAVRAACAALGSLDLHGAIVYASGYPCAMCLAAMQLAGVAEVVFAYSNEDGAPYGFSTDRLYTQIANPFSGLGMTGRYLPVRLEGADPYELWRHR